MHMIGIYQFTDGVKVHTLYANRWSLMSQTLKNLNELSSAWI